LLVCKPPDFLALHRGAAFAFAGLWYSDCITLPESSRTEGFRSPHLFLGASFMSNHEVVVAVIGLDQPGVIACVSSVITRLGCNIREMTQSTLHEQFAGIYLVDKPQELSNETLNAEIEKAVALKKMRLTIVTRDYEEPSGEPVPSEPFVISVYGPDRNDIVATFSHIFGAQQINISSMRAFPIGEGSSMQVFEVSIPTDLDTRSLHRVLLERAKSLGLSLTMQHRDIFEAVHRVTVI
jgi:glycine cleavage system transcriptional repressor